jgi:phospholipid/cholesterol/gamma-HCH transport system substrate-binding protein
MQRTIEKRAWWVFVALLLAASAAALAWYLGLGRGEATYELRTQDPVSGLIEGAPVEFHGVEVGHVRQVRLLDARTVQVLLRLRRDAPVTTSTVATISGRGLATRGFTGYVYVSLEDAAPGGAALATRPGEPYARIPTAPLRSVSLDTSIHELNDSVRSVIALLQDTLDPNTVRALKGSVANLEQVSGVLAADQAKLKATIANMERASARLMPLLQSGGEVTRELRDRVLPQAQDTLARMDSVAGSANATVQHVAAASRELAPLVQSSNSVMRSVQAQLLPQMRQGLARTNELLSKLDDTAERVRDNPSVLVWGSRARSASGQHPREGVVAPAEMMVEGGAGVQCGQGQQRIGQPAVQHDQGLEQPRVLADQVRQVEPAEHGNGVSTR